ncbi:probable calcium-binding protein CML25 [Rutidosis leptorrhynchoides]|uniref:probable calcium-binding protein CML25 n=1 Tax=Rutidosis leptorrhynchoides TaxID=125765 RepID=UPI003A9A048B
MGLKDLLNRKKKKKNGGDDSNNNNSSHKQPPESIVSSDLQPSDSRVRIEEELEQVFKKFDVNGDGKISASELGSILGSLGHQPTNEELTNMIKEVDADGDGFIDLREFIELNTKDIDSNEVLDNLKNAFSVFDVDNNGLITAEELQNVLKKLGDSCSINESRKMIAGADRDGDGMINFDEFKDMMMSGSKFESKQEIVSED